MDVWRGWQSRKHDDIEIAVLRCNWPIMASRFGANRHFGAAQRKGRNYHLISINQIWLAGQEEDVCRLEIFLEPGDDETWVFRRNPEVPRQRQMMTAASADGVPYLKPEGVLRVHNQRTKPTFEPDCR